MAFVLDDAPTGKFVLDDAPAAPLSGWDRFSQGMKDPIDGGAQLLTKVLPDSWVKAGNTANNWLADKTGLVGRLPEGGVSQQVREGEADYQRRRGEGQGVDWARLGGNVLSPANVALGASLPRAAGLAGNMFIGAGGGAASAALTPVTSGDDSTFGADKAKQMGFGAAFGAATPVVTGALGRLISPNASQNADLALLRNEGVQPTIGQTLGGAANTIEQKLTSLPIMGDAISAARSRPQDQFNTAAINRAVAPVGEKVQGSGTAAVKEAGDILGSKYDAARTALNGGFQMDRTAALEIVRLNQMVASLPPQQQKTWNKIFTEVGTDISPNGTVPADVFKKIDSKLTQEAARYQGNADPYHSQLGDALAELRKSIENAGRRANAPAADMFKAADKGWANLTRVEGASTKAMNTGGVFTPGQLNMAVRGADQSVRDRATARGTALMQDLGTAGQNVLGNKVPDSGTAGRVGLAGLAGLSGMYNPLIPAGLIGGALGYTPLPQAIMRGAVASRPQGAAAVREALNQSAPMLLPGAGQAGAGLMQYLGY